MKLGATGKFPEGKLNQEDEGGLTLAITYDSHHNVVRIEFGKPVAWIAYSPEQAIEFANLIIKHAKRANN